MYVRVQSTSRLALAASPPPSLHIYVLVPFYKQNVAQKPPHFHLPPFLKKPKHTNSVLMLAIWVSVQFKKKKKNKNPWPKKKEKKPAPLQIQSLPALRMSKRNKEQGLATRHNRQSCNFVTRERHRAGSIHPSILFKRTPMGSANANAQNRSG